jgi:hypothetical protein
MVVRGPSGGYVRGGPFHSQNPEAGFIHTPGLKVVYPSTAEDADRIADEVRDEMQAAVDFGISSPFPDPARTLDHVYA